MEGTGRLLRVGKGASTAAGEPLKPDDRIFFRGYLKDVSRMIFEPEDDCPVFMLHADDVLGFVGDSVKMGAVP